MGKRKSFSISVDQSKTFEDIGAMAAPPVSTTPGNMSPERIAELKALMNKPVAKMQDSSDDNTIDAVVPAHHEELILRSKLSAAPDEWNFFGRPKPDQYALIFQSIYKYGLWHPCTVWEQEDGTYMILGGHTRNLVYEDLYTVTNDEKYLSIPCKVYKHDQISEATARRIIILTNIAQRAQENPGIRVRCYCEMARLEKQDSFYGSGVDVNEAVAKLFGVSRTTVFFYRRLEKLIEPLLIAYDNNQISRSIVNILCGLSTELQEYIYKQGYHLKFTPSMSRKLKKAVTTDDIDEIMAAPDHHKEHFQYVVSTKFKKPSNFDFIPLAVNHEEVSDFKTFLANALAADDKLSDHTKKVIQEMIK